MVEAAGQLVRIFRYRLDYAFIPDRLPAGMRGVLFGEYNVSANPSTRSVMFDLSEPMSLYRAEKVGPSPPLGVAMPSRTTTYSETPSGFTE